MKNLRGVPPKRKGGEGNISGDTIREPFAYFEVPMEEDVVVKIFAGCPPLVVTQFNNLFMLK